MEKELLNIDKELLLQDLCARLPYGVKIAINDKVESLQGINILDNVAEYGSFLSFDIEEVKPYLYPLSSMTTKQKTELSMLVVGVEDIFKAFLIEVEFYHKHHIDYRGLIPMGLAVDATGLNIY